MGMPRFVAMGTSILSVPLLKLLMTLSSEAAWKSSALIRSLPRQMSPSTFRTSFQKDISRRIAGAFPISSFREPRRAA